MIKSRQDYYEYLKADESSLGMLNRKYPPPGEKPSFLGKIRHILRRFVFKTFHPIPRFERALRRHEYYHNCFRHIWQKPLVLYAHYQHTRLGIKCGFTIPINVFGKGMNIAHIGTIIVNPYAVIGDYCRIHACTNIGAAAGSPKEHPQVPHIGNRVYIGPGAKLFGDIVIADDVAIGANSVVNKSFTTPGITIAGVPARKINDKGSFGLLYAPEEE